MTTFYRTTPFPKCKFCGKQMDYWIFGQPDNEASHDACFINDAVENSLKIFRDEFKKNIAKRKGI